ncbi:hypothetical protein [Ferruginibacter sp. SUN106]|uniref:hypothetical protein n=1 Tax=Ferruginibacter sp. SUN106 TaxID=2978348 RepID=UPI003D3683F0
MKKNFFISMLLFVCCNLFAQLKVETIKTDKDALAFLNQYYFKVNQLKLSVDYYSNTDIRNKFSDEMTSKYFDKHNVYHWVKADLNNDGKSDLIWNGCINKTAALLAFISDKKKRYLVTILSDSAEDQTLHLIKPYKEDAFILIRIDPEKNYGDTSYHFENRFMYDTIAYCKNVFVEFNSLNKHYQIDTIRFWNRGVFSSINEETITICRNGKVLNSVDLYLDTITRRLVMSKELSKDSIEYLFSIAENLPFYCIKEYYRYVLNNSRDLSTRHLEFMFSNGTKKKLSAYHNSAPFGVKFLIDWLRKLNKNDNWILESDVIASQQVQNKIKVQ